MTNNMFSVRSTALVFTTGLTLLFGVAGQAADTKSATQANEMGLSARAKSFASERWNDSSPAQGLALLSDTKETPTSRAAAMQTLQANRRKLTPGEMRQFLGETTKLAKDTSVDETNSAFAVSVMGNATLTMKEQGQLSDAESKQEARFLLETATDARHTALLRASAITALGVLKVAEANGALREMLTNSTTRDVPEIARPACLSLMRVDGERAIPDLANILKKTSDARVFGTAAFALGQFKDGKCIAALVANLDRFPDAGACGAALVEMVDTIGSILKNPQDENLTAAIQATRHLWREGQRENCAPLLRDLLSVAPLEARKAAAERLLESASCLELEAEKRELALISKAMGDQPELHEHQQRIQSRLSAGIATPVAGIGILVPTVLKTEERK